MHPWTEVSSPSPIDEVSLYRFSLPYRRPLGTQHERKGLLLRCRRAGFVGWGEVSPWPGLHLANVDALVDALSFLFSQNLGSWVPENVCSAVMPAQNNGVEDVPAVHRQARTWLQALPPVSSWGIVSASLQLLAAERGMPLGKLLQADASERVRVAALVLEEQDFHETDCEAFTAIKVKSRRPEDTTLLARVRERLPHIEIRADGNRALSLESAWRMIEETSPHRVRFFEEPVPTEVLPALIARGADIALDESLSMDDLSPELLRASCLWVLKPSVLGPFRTFALLHAGKPVVLSSPFESAVGRHVLAQLQSAYSPEEAAGLGVAQYFAADLDAAPPLSSWLSCNDQPTVDETRLHKIGTWVRT